MKGVSVFDVDSEHHDLEFMEMVHEVEWQYIDVYKGE